MQFVIFASLAVLAAAAPSDEKNAAILRDDRIQEDDGRYNFDVETANGITLSQSGAPGDDTGAISKAGQYSYTAPDGTNVQLKFVANQNGFQPESNMLPVAPEFPHAIPQFVLDQIAKAAEEARLRAEGKLGSQEYL